MLRRIFGPAIASVALVQAMPVLADAAQDAVAAPSRTDADRLLDVDRKPLEILRFAGIKPGDIVADFMAGGGYYSAMIADMVGNKGMVYAINPVRLHDPKKWEQRLAAHRNIRAISVNANAMQLAPGSVDLIFTHLNFHDLYWESERFEIPRLDVAMILANWFAAVRPGGHVIVADHAGPGGDPREVTQALHRIAPETVIAAMAHAGFTLVGESDVLHRSEDDRSLNVFNEAIRGKTDRFVLKFQRP